MDAADFGTPKSSSDFGTPQQPPTSSLSASDFGAPKSQSDFGAPATSSVTTTQTPHKYDSIIRDAAKPYGLDPNIMRAIGMQETGLGTSSNYDPKTGLDRDKNPGHGLFQLDPASSMPKAVLDKAAKDPSFAAQTAARMMKSNLRATNGDLRGALAMYNAGSATSPQGLAYADSVIGRMKSDDNPDYSPEIIQKVVHDYKMVSNAVRAGKPLATALSYIPEGKPLHNVEVRGANALTWFSHHKVEGALDILGAPQRFLGGLEEASAQGEGKNALHDAMDMVFNPTAKNQERATRGPQDVINRFAREHGAKGSVVPTHDEIDHYIHANTRIPAVVKPWASAILKGGEDFIQQTLSDPTQSSQISRVLRFMGGHATGAVIKAVAATANTMGIGTHFAHLPIVHGAVEKATQLFGIRNDLDKAGFTKEGKNARLAIENSEISRHADHQKAAEAAANSADASEAHLMKLAHEHGSPQVSALAARHPSRVGKTVAIPTRGVRIRAVLGATPTQAIRAMTPQERKEAFGELHTQIRDAEIKRRTNEIVKSNPDMLAGHPTTTHKSIVDSLNTQDLAELHTWLDKGVDFSRPLANLGKRSVTWNPIPHGLVNVGTLAYQAGGIPAVMRGFVHMVNPTGINPAMLERLRDMGALDDYSRESWSPTSPMGKFFKAYGDVAGHALERMEQGWRAGLLETIDQKLGKSLPGSKEELLKGRMVSERIGDYRNRSAFAKMFQTLGGPFVMFRLGIVPQNFMKTLKENPERIASQLRMMYDLDNNSGLHGKQLSFGGPTGDVLKFISNPMKFLASPSTAGPIAQAYAIASNYHGLVDTGLQLGEAYIPYLEALTKAGKEASGINNQTVPDMIADFLMKNFLEIDQTMAQRGRIIKANMKKTEKQIGL